MQSALRVISRTKIYEIIVNSNKVNEFLQRINFSFLSPIVWTKIYPNSGVRYIRGKFHRFTLLVPTSNDFGG